MILVTGANGTIGSEVVKQLIDSGQSVRALVRDPAKAAKLGGKVEVVQGDLSKPETLGVAFRGVEKAFLLATGPGLPQLDGHAIDAAKAGGVKHIVKLSVLGATMDPGLIIGRWHRAGETKLESSGIAWTFLRPGGFFTNALGWASTIKAQGAVYAPLGEGKSASIDPRDVAAVGVAALTKPGHEGKAYDLTGPQALSMAEQVQAISVAIGKPLKFVDVPEAAAKGGMLKAGMPEPLVNGLLELMALTKAGKVAMVSNAVEQVTGKPARTFEAWAREFAAAFQ